MAEVTMPRLSDTMEEGTISAWLKKPGDQVNRGEVIAQIETDKATMDLTVFEAGTLQEILAPEGTTVQIGKPVARIGGGAASKSSQTEARESTKGTKSSDSASAAARESTESTKSSDSASADSREATEGSKSSGSASADGREAAASTTSSGSASADASEAGEGSESSDSASARDSGSDSSARASEEQGERNGKVRASPMARHMAAEHGLDLTTIEGSGPQGRVVRADIEAALAGSSAQSKAPASPDGSAQATGSTGDAKPAAPQAEGDERIPLSQMRRTIARRMAESTRTVPHFFLTITVDATELVALRKQVVEQLAESGPKVSINDLVVKAAALALRKVPDVNVSFAEDALIKHRQVNIGIAVATERGLIVPVVRDVDTKTLSQIARETRDLAERAQSGKLQPPDYSGGTFTISNLGMFGVEQFNAVINPPEAAILAVGAITREPSEFNGEIALRERMTLTLSVDHRALDGAMGARYLQALKALLEKPLLLLV